MNGYSMPRYFQTMKQLGNPARIDEANEAAILELEADIKDRIAAVQADGRSDESLNSDGQMTALQRIYALVDEGTWCPLNSLYNPADNENGSTSIIKGLGRVAGRWAVIVASDNKKLAGSWVPGQPENLIRASDTAKCLHIPLIYLLNCAGMRLDKQHLLFSGKRSGGTPFYRNSELQQLGIPVIGGIFGTNPAGGGYHSISHTIIIAHKDSNMAIAGDGIKSGMQPKGYIDHEVAVALAEAHLREDKPEPPGTVKTHYDYTGFMREVYDDDMGVIDAMRKYMSYLPAYQPEFFRVAPPMKPAFPTEELYSVLPINSKRTYNVYEVIARLVDGGALMEYKKDYGPEVITGLTRVNGYLVALIANQQGFFQNYPAYRGPNAFSVGGKLYREGLIKMCEFVDMCTRDKIPIIWMQDTTGIDLDDLAEKAELLGIGHGLIYSIQNSTVPQMEITLRKASGASHFVMGGPQGKANAFSITTAASEYYAIYGETAAAAMYVRRLARAYKNGQPMDDIIKKMNEMLQEFNELARPHSAAKMGLVDEVVDIPRLRDYMVAFTESAYQNPVAHCPFHQMITVRTIAEYNAKNGIVD